MKKYLIIVLSVCIFACSQGQKNDLSTVKGKWQRGTSKSSVSLFAIKNGSMEEIATSKIDTDSTFCFAFTHNKSALYIIGLAGMQYKDKYEFYFKPGDRLNVEINDTSYVLVGDNTKENLALEDWHNLFFPLEYSSLYKAANTYVEYFPLLEKMLPQIEGYKSPYSGNDNFNQVFANMRELDVLHASLYLVASPRITHPHADDFPDYYKKIDRNKYTSTDILLTSPTGMFLLNMSDFTLRKFTPDLPALSIESISDPALKAEFIIQKARILKTYQGYVDFEEKYGKFLVNNDHKERFKALVANLPKPKIGEKAVGFNFPDLNGKNVSLADLKGKVVYIDVWATWCGPCRGEIPHLKKLEKEFEKRELAFVSISVDAQKDYEKWKKVVKDEELKGIQLFGGNNPNNIKKPYNIDGIPRFILIDKEGNLVAADAPRPSSSEIRGLLEQLLK